MPNLAPVFVSVVWAAVALGLYVNTYNRAIEKGEDWWFLPVYLIAMTFFWPVGLAASILDDLIRKVWDSIQETRGGRHVDE